MKGVPFLPRWYKRVRGWSTGFPVSNLVKYRPPPPSPGTCCKIVKRGNHVYFVHPSTDASVNISADVSVDISTDTRPICQSSYRPSLDRYIDRDMSVDISTDMSIETSAECRSIYRPTIGRYNARHSADTLTIDCRWNIGRLSVVYRSTLV